MVDIISHCGDYLLTLINDILDISKIESNKIIIESEAFDFFSLIHDIVEIFKLSTDQKNIRFVANIPDSIPKIVIGDEKRLRQRLQMAAISAYAEEEKVAAAMESGFNEYLVKPIDEMHLRKFLFEDRHQTFEATEHATLIEKGK